MIEQIKGILFYETIIMIFKKGIIKYSRRGLLGENSDF